MHYIRSSKYKQRAWCAASVHGNENGATLVPTAPETWAAYFNRTWTRRDRPHFITKCDDSTTATNLTDHVASANRAGFRTIVQLRDDVAAMRSEAAAIAEVRATLAIFAAAGATPTALQYGNEPEFNNTALALTPQVYPDRQAAVYGAVGDLVGEFVMGGLGSWANASDFAKNFAQAQWPSTVRTYSVHQHRGHPDLPFRFHVPGYLRRLLPGYELANHETGLLPAHADLSTNKVAAYDVLNNLCHADAGIPCCDYTLINGSATPGTGNGLFLRDGSDNPSGAALRDMVAPFLESNMRKAWAPSDVGPRVFATQAGQVILASAPEPAADNIQKSFNQALLGRTEAEAEWGVAHGDVFNWVSGAGAKPDAPPTALRNIDLGRFQTIYDETTAASGRITTRIHLPVAASSALTLGTEYYDSAPSDVSINGDILTITHDAYTALRLQVS